MNLEKLSKIALLIATLVSPENRSTKDKNFSYNNNAYAAGIIQETKATTTHGKKART